MALKKGVCEEYGDCREAQAGTKFEVDEKAFVCPNCGKPLQPATGRPDPGSGIATGTGPKKDPARAALVVGVLIVVLFAAGWGIMRWIEGSPHLVFVDLPAEPISFGTVALNDSLPRALTVRNDGTGVLTLKVTGRSGPTFLCRPALLKIPAGQEKTLTITYQPQQVDEEKQAIAFNTNDRTNRNPRLSLEGRGAKHGPWWIWEEWEKNTTVLNPITR
jgi:hypothetical protein